MFFCLWHLPTFMSRILPEKYLMRLIYITLDIVGKVFFFFINLFLCLKVTPAI